MRALLLFLLLVAAPAQSYTVGSYSVTVDGVVYGPYADPITACAATLPGVSKLPYSAGPVKNSVALGDASTFTCQADFMQFSGVYWTQPYATFLPAIGKSYITTYTATPPATTGTGTGTTGTGTTAASGTACTVTLDTTALNSQLTAINNSIANNNVFAIPASGDFAAAWSAGFILPMTLSLVAWAVAAVVNTFKERQD